MQWSKLDHKRTHPHFPWSPVDYVGSERARPIVIGDLRFGNVSGMHPDLLDVAQMNVSLLKLAHRY